ncbi:MAG: DUF192 domain-containing protein [Syntrophomonadaceae bacterium]|mgnify:CR=1 FL=1|jgi:uncharacterized membrane protein (UPF0127 family)|nr:DUF192 domain-containing protein [Bacillota bacterium]
MRKVHLRTASGRVLVDQCMLANTFFGRLKGLLGKKELSSNEALLLIPCDMIHTLGMRFSIDAIFVDKQGEIIKIEENLKPHRLAARVRNAHSVVEMAAGMTKKLGLVPGDTLRW